ncbi:MFS transporter [Planosporangium mesophilum]|uniref:Uncharacterized protein n=1 Tax=Planosporangium mesophilum TaxID=689768 RepID=A0A8J3T8R2_9ACTN|nr:MFS transporter [Planosporangium mesophilum]NJC83178.1 MFS transporter [Planosporangium mesophilum]GII22600.1 hypothetical protein Pme01_21970 [Planosporangium mesophilum]
MRRRDLFSRTEEVSPQRTLSLLTLIPGPVSLVVVVAVGSVFVQAYVGPLFAFPIQHLGARAAGITSGFGNFCANLGGFAFSCALGAVKDATGSFRVGFLTLGGMCALALLVTVSLRRRPRPPRRRARP